MMAMQELDFQTVALNVKLVMLALFPIFSLSQILRKCGGSVELLDVSAELPNLIRRPGLKKWKVCLYF